MLIAERLVAQHTLLTDRERRFRRLFESGVTGVTLSDFDGNLKEANDAFLGMLGYTHDDMLAGTVELGSHHAPRPARPGHRSPRPAAHHRLRAPRRERVPPQGRAAHRGPRRFDGARGHHRVHQLRHRHLAEEERRGGASSVRGAVPHALRAGPVPEVPLRPQDAALPGRERRGDAPLRILARRIPPDVPRGSPAPRGRLDDCRERRLGSARDREARGLQTSEEGPDRHRRRHHRPEVRARRADPAVSPSRWT